MRFLVDKVALEQVIVEFIRFSPANYHSTIAPFYIFITASSDIRFP
jgi:hypothetical protein